VCVCVCVCVHGRVDPNVNGPALFLVRGGAGHSQVALEVPSDSQGKVLSFLNKHCAAVAGVWDAVKDAVKQANAEVKRAKEEAAAAARQLEEQLANAEKEDLTGDGGIIKQVFTVCLSQLAVTVRVCVCLRLCVY
jgi:hypothetical protein